MIGEASLAWRIALAWLIGCFCSKSPTRHARQAGGRERRPACSGGARRWAQPQIVGEAPATPVVSAHSRSCCAWPTKPMMGSTSYANYVLKVAAEEVHRHPNHLPRRRRASGRRTGRELLRPRRPVHPVLPVGGSRWIWPSSICMPSSTTRPGGRPRTLSRCARVTRTEPEEHRAARASCRESGRCAIERLAARGSTAWCGSSRVGRAGGTDEDVGHVRLLHEPEMRQQVIESVAGSAHLGRVARRDRHVLGDDREQTTVQL